MIIPYSPQEQYLYLILRRCILGEEAIQTIQQLYPEGVVGVYRINPVILNGIVQE